MAKLSTEDLLGQFKEMTIVVFMGLRYRIAMGMALDAWGLEHWRLAIACCVGLVGGRITQ